MSIKDQFRAHLPRKELDVPALGGKVELIALTARDMSAVLKAASDEMAGATEILARSLYKNGARIVPDGEAGALLELPNAVFQALLREATALNGLDKSAEGNSSATDASGSSTG